MIDTRANALKQLAILLVGSSLLIGFPGFVITGDWHYFYMMPIVFGLPMAFLQGVFDRRLWRNSHGSEQPQRVR